MPFSTGERRKKSRRVVGPAEESETKERERKPRGVYDIIAHHAVYARNGITQRGS